jgi:hypothetical protein
MPLRGVRCIRGTIDLAEHMRCMVESTGPPCGVEPSILQMILRPNAEREAGEVIFSPSSISSCHRRTALGKDEDYYLDIRQGYKMVRGSIFHQGLGQEPAYPGVLGVVRELRMGSLINTKYGEKTFHGKPDAVVLLRTTSIEHLAWTEGGGEMHDLERSMKTTLHVKLVDYKTRGEIGHDLVEADPRHVIQINEYAWLVRRFLPGWLNQVLSTWPSDYQEHLFMEEGTLLPLIDEVVVDELSIVYLDMSRSRTFSSLGFLYDQGKMISDYIDGRYVRRKPVEYEELELEIIHMFQDPYIGGKIRRGVEGQIEAETMLAPPLTGSDARLMCGGCEVKQACYELGRQEGYSMEDQIRYASIVTGP